jgi:hypothetical protein
MLSCNSGGVLITERTRILNARRGFVSSTVLLLLEVSSSVDQGKDVCVCVCGFCTLYVGGNVYALDVVRDLCEYL